MRCMKVLLTYLFSTLVLLQSLHIDVRDIMGLRDFIAHAKYHKQTHDDDFADFLSKHYGRKKHEHHQKNQEEHHEHEKLPFSNCSIPNAPFFLPEQKVITEPSRLIPIERENNFGYRINYASPALFDIFQPPKTA